MTDRPDDLRPASTIEEVSPTVIAADTEAPVTSPLDGPPRSRLGRHWIRSTGGGIAAVGVKELRGRMRGRRAFMIMTIYLLVLGGFAWMVQVMMERTLPVGFGGAAAFSSATIGQGIFVGLLMLETLFVVFLAPLATAGSISLEREKQTLDMLAATPITSFAIVVGKLLSALIYVWLLIAASIPLTAVVFVFGGVAPDDLVRGYLVLVVTALGFGSFGLFCSSVVKRTEAATAITIVGVLGVTTASLAIIVFLQALATPVGIREGVPGQGAASGPVGYLNPFLAQADVAPADALCVSDNALRYYCRFRETFLLAQNGVIFTDSDGGGAVPVPMPAPAFPVGNEKRGLIVVEDMVNDAGNDVAPFGVVREALWPKTVAAWLVLSLIFLTLSVQLVSPTRRWRPRLRRATKGIPA